MNMSKMDRTMDSVENFVLGMKREAKTVKRDIIIIDAAVMLLGLLLVFFPAQSSNIICRVFGGILAVLGVLRVISYFAAERTEAFGSFALVTGAAMLAFGVYFLAKPAFLAGFLTVLLAIVLFIGGVMKLQYAIDLMRLNAYGWWVQLIGAGLMVVLGIVAFADPFDASQALMLFIGASLLVNGLWDIVSVIYLTGIIKKVKNKVEQVAEEATAIPVTPQEPTDETKE
jgi:uncharacterized membrane protein HdeD (DUF308 family)